MAFYPGSFKMLFLMNIEINAISEFGSSRERAQLLAYDGCDTAVKISMAYV